MTCAKAVAAAIAVARENGFVDGVNGIRVVVNVPPDNQSNFGGLPGHIQVTISSRRASFFQGLLGLANRSPRAIAVAANISGINLPISFIALNPSACGLSKVTGNGTLIMEGAVHVDSKCAANALTVSGKGAMTVPTCNVVGGFQISGGGTADCEKPSGVTPIGDPLAELPAPGVPGTPRPVEVISGSGGIPSGCPGSSTPATMASPALCTFSKAGEYRIFPGLYPGGLKFNSGTVYMEPGIYYIAGGGFTKSGGGSATPTIISVDPGGTTPGGGILIYNTCPTGQTTNCLGSIQINGSAGATIDLRPIQTTVYRNMLIFQDRSIRPSSASVVLNGNENFVTLSGTVYVPTGEVQINGSGSGVAAQVIADSFKVNGDGELRIGYDATQFVRFQGVGLVQ